MQALGAIGVYRADQQFAWRGFSSIDYAMESSLQRWLRDHGRATDENSVREVEVETLKNARDWGLGVGRYGKIDDLQLLADLQHYGIPTRLIDFTSNPMTALWFACQSSVVVDPSKLPSPSGLVLALNVSGWNTYSSGEALLTSDNAAKPWTNTLEHGLTQSPFLVRPLEPNTRMTAQEGFFATGPVPDSVEPRDVFKAFKVTYTRLGAGELPLERKGRGAPKSLPFVAVVVRSQLKPQLQRYLDKTYNRSARVLFPDFPGFRQFGF